MPRQPSDRRCCLQDEFAQFEANDPWLEMFIYNMDQVTSTFKVSAAAVPLPRPAHSTAGVL